MSSMSAKNKTLLFVVILLIIFASLFTAILYWHKKQELMDAEKNYLNSVNTTYNKILNKQNNFYDARANANLSSDGTKEALFNKDRKKLFELSKGRWKTLKSSNKFLSMMDFYMADGTVLLRMHAPDKFDDNVAQSRPIINSAITHHKSLHGFELETNYLGYRSITPVFIESRYIGALEFATRPDEIFSEMEYISGLKGALFVKTPSEKGYRIGEYTLQYNAMDDDSLIKVLKESGYAFEMFRHCKIGEKSYAIYSFDLNDFEGKSVAKAVFFNDITKIINHFYVTLFEMIAILFSLLVLLVIVINIGFHKIITKLDQAIEESNAAQKKLSNYVELIDRNVIVSTTDLSGKIVSASQAFCTISEYSLDEIIGQTHRIVRHPDMPDSLFKEVWETIVNHGVWQGEIKNRTKNGGYYWVMSTIYPLYDDEGNITGYTAIRHDITDKKRVEELSITDGLTNIYNRRYFEAVFSKFINTAKRNNDILCFCMIDIDYFKLYNDTYGHQAGDSVLMKVAETIQHTLKRSDDFCFRLGGEEFGVLMRVSDEDSMCDFAHQLREMVEELKIPHIHNQASSYVTISIGQYCDNGLNISTESELYRWTDELLYQAKNGGRNQVKSNRCEV